MFSAKLFISWDGLPGPGYNREERAHGNRKTGSKGERTKLIEQDPGESEKLEDEEPRYKFIEYSKTTSFS